jgi:hypothetical protein
MIRVNISWGPLNRTAEIHESTGKRLNDFAGKWRQEGETWGRFVERVLDVFEAHCKANAGRPEPEDPFRGVKRVDGGRSSVRVLMLLFLNVAALVFMVQGRWLWALFASLPAMILAWPTFRELWRLWKMSRIIRRTFGQGGPPGSAQSPAEMFGANFLKGEGTSRTEPLQELFPAVAPPHAESEKDVADGVCCSCNYSGFEETECPARTDKTHCVHWWDGPDAEGVSFEGKEG